LADGQPFCTRKKRKPEGQKISGLNFYAGLVFP